MRSPLGRRVRRRFGARLKQILPQFDEAKDELIPQGCRLYRWRPGGAVTFYLFLLIDPQSDRFTVEVVWTLTGQWPPTFRGWGAPDDQPTEGTVEFRLCRFWEPKQDIWWEVARLPTMEDLERAILTLGDYEEALENALPRVEPLVDDAINRIEQHALPYFANIAARYGQEV